MRDDTAIYDPAAPATAGAQEPAKGHQPAKVARAAVGVAGLTLILLTVLQTWTADEITRFVERAGVPFVLGAGLLFVVYTIGSRLASAAHIGVKEFNLNLGKLQANVEGISRAMMATAESARQNETHIRTSLTTIVARTEHMTSWFSDLYRRVEALEERKGASV